MSSFRQRGRDDQDRVESDDDDDYEGEEEEHEAGEVFADYRPRKLNIGIPHPDAVVETASLAAVEPPDITYQLNIQVKRHFHIILKT